MDTWTWGPLVLHQYLVIVLAAAAIGYGVLNLRLRRSPERTAITSAAMSGALIWLLVWKWGWVLTDIQSIWTNPQTLLYFSGGRYAAWLASAAAVIYVGISLERRKIGRPVYSDSLLAAILGGYVGYLALSAVLGGKPSIAEISGAVLGIAILIVWLIGSREFSPKAALQRVILFGIGFAVLITVSDQLKDRGVTLSGGDGEVGLRVGQQAPDFTLSLLSGEEVKLSDYRGSVVFVNFWATWCPPCQAEMPYMQQFYTNNEKDRVVILGVNETQTEASLPVVKAWVEEWKLTFPIPLDRAGEVGKLYRVQAYPATFVIDEEGIIRQKHPGPMDEGMLESALRAIRGKK